MPKLRLLHSKKSLQLSMNIQDNLDAYRSGKFKDLEVNSSNYIEISMNYDADELKLVDCDSKDHKEVDCCIHIHNALTDVTPYIARDSRLWIYLTHTLLLEYSRKRWPIPSDDEKAINHIKTHFFGNGARGIERDNAASRLWWMATLCEGIGGLSIHDALRVLLHEYDVRAGIVERPTTSQNISIRAALLKKLNTSYNADKALFQREKFRLMMKKLNLLGGVRLLATLDETEISNILDECFN